jgi:hypothetical protein
VIVSQPSYLKGFVDVLGKTRWRHLEGLPSNGT